MAEKNNFTVWCIFISVYNTRPTRSGAPHKSEKACPIPYLNFILLKPNPEPGPHCRVKSRPPCSPSTKCEACLILSVRMDRTTEPTGGRCSRYLRESIFKPWMVAWANFEFGTWQVQSVPKWQNPRVQMAYSVSIPELRTFCPTEWTWGTWSQHKRISPTRKTPSVKMAVSQSQSDLTCLDELAWPDDLTDWFCPGEAQAVPLRLIRCKNEQLQCHDCISREISSNFLKFP